MPHFVGSRDESLPNMSCVSSDFASLRLSALRKASQISSSIHKVTIGPNSKGSNTEESWADNLENEQNTCNVIPSADVHGQTKNSNISSRSSIMLSAKKILLEKEKQRCEEVRKAIEQHRRHMEKSVKAVQEEAAMTQWIDKIQRERKEAEEVERLEAEEERLAQQNEIRRKHEQQLQDQRIQERKEKLEREAEEHRRTREREELINRIGPLRTSFREKCRDIGSLSKACKDRNSAAVILTPLANRLKELSMLMESVNEKTRTGDISAPDLNIAENVMRQSEEIMNICKWQIARIDAQFEEEIARREQAVREAESQVQTESAHLAECSEAQSHIIPEQSPLSPETPLGSKQVEDSAGIEPVIQLASIPPNEGNPNSPEAAVTKSDPPSVETATEETEGDFSDHEALRSYMNIHVFLTNYAATYRELAQETSLKKFRFECQKGINIPVNAISGVSGSHLKDKYEMLRSLVMGKSSLTVSQYPQGVAFCKDILAKKIVSQGETLISSKPEMAFPVAAVTVALWNDYPDFGELLLAHFCRTCPYILPVFLPRLQGQTNEEYYRSLGYKYNEDGVVENQDKYLTRMSGLMRLYVSIIVTRQRTGVNKPHPHGIQNAWRWLAITLNAEARTDLSDVCATLILDILEVAGNSLWQAYPRQFPKMLMLLTTQYYPLMQNEAGIGGGPMARLEQFLKDCIAKNSIPPPEGQLPPNFW